MLIPSRGASQAFVRLAPDLQEISQFISTSRLNPRERVRFLGSCDCIPSSGWYPHRLA